eukprot:351796-Chlamydomonas_euryale.AAC.2
MCTPTYCMLTLRPASSTSPNKKGRQVRDMRVCAVARLTLSGAVFSATFESPLHRRYARHTQCKQHARSATHMQHVTCYQRIRMQPASMHTAPKRANTSGALPLVVRTTCTHPHPAFCTQVPHSIIDGVVQRAEEALLRAGTSRPPPPCNLHSSSVPSSACSLFYRWCPQLWILGSAVGRGGPPLEGVALRVRSLGCGVDASQTETAIALPLRAARPSPFGMRGVSVVFCVASKEPHRVGQRRLRSYVPFPTECGKRSTSGASPAGIAQVSRVVECLICVTRFVRTRAVRCRVALAVA